LLKGIIFNKYSKEINFEKEERIGDESF